MEFIFEMLLEGIFEPIIEAYINAMTRFYKGSKNINENVVKACVCVEFAVLFLMFIIGGVMLAESQGESLAGKIVFILSIAVSTVQLILALVLKGLK